MVLCETRHSPFRGAFAVALPPAGCQNNYGDILRVAVRFQLGEKLNTIHLTRKQNACDDDICCRRNGQCIARRRTRDGH
jgi:hypothetical protein